MIAVLKAAPEEFPDPVSSQHNIQEPRELHIHEKASSS